MIEGTWNPKVESKITIFNPKQILLLRFYLLKSNLNYSRIRQREAISEPPCDPPSKLTEKAFYRESWARRTAVLGRTACHAPPHTVTRTAMRLAVRGFSGRCTAVPSCRLAVHCSSLLLVAPGACRTSIPPRNASQLPHFLLKLVSFSSLWQNS